MRIRRPSPRWTGLEAVLRKGLLDSRTNLTWAGTETGRAGKASFRESCEVAGLGAGLGDMNAEGSKFARSSRVILACRRLALMLGGDGKREESSRGLELQLITGRNGLSRRR